MSNNHVVMKELPTATDSTVYCSYLVYESKDEAYMWILHDVDLLLTAQCVRGVKSTV
jgi:hypothetical protein